MPTPTGRTVTAGPQLQALPLNTPEAHRLREAFRREFSPYSAQNRAQATTPQTPSESQRLAPIPATHATDPFAGINTAPNNYAED